MTEGDRTSWSAEDWVLWYETGFATKEFLRTDEEYGRLYRGFLDSSRRGQFVRALDFASAIYFAWRAYNGEEMQFE